MNKISIYDLLTKNLDPTVEYCFTLSDNLSPSVSQSQIVGPYTVREFMGAHHKSVENVISIDVGRGIQANNVWALDSGWSASALYKLVSQFVRLIGREYEVLPEFIRECIANKLSVSESIYSFFEGAEILPEFKHHQGAGQYEISFSSIHFDGKVILPLNVCVFDLINLYIKTGDELKSDCCVWEKDLMNTLKNYKNRNQEL